MIVPVWEERGPITEDGEIQEETIPQTKYVRMLMQYPTVDDLDKLKQALLDYGVPLHAELGFEQWNRPPSNWYVHAKWFVEG